MRRITLPQTVRTLRRISDAGIGLCSTDDWVDADTTLVVSEPMVMEYDHKPQRVVYFKDDDGKEHFLIVDELGVDGFVQ